MQCNNLDITRLNWNVPFKAKGGGASCLYLISNHVLYSHENQPALPSTILVPPKTISRYIHMNNDIVRTHTPAWLVGGFYLYSTPTKSPL
jgi:hypothetical protein